MPTSKNETGNWAYHGGGDPEVCNSCGRPYKVWPGDDCQFKLFHTPFKRAREGPSQSEEPAGEAPASIRIERESERIRKTPDDARQTADFAKDLCARHGCSKTTTDKCPYCRRLFCPEHAPPSVSRTPLAGTHVCKEYEQFKSKNILTANEIYNRKKPPAGGPSADDAVALDSQAGSTSDRKCAFCGKGQSERTKLWDCSGCGGAYCVQHIKLEEHHCESLPRITKLAPTPAVAVPTMERGSSKFQVGELVIHKEALRRVVQRRRDSGGWVYYLE